MGVLDSHASFLNLRAAFKSRTGYFVECPGGPPSLISLVVWFDSKLGTLCCSQSVRDARHASNVLDRVRVLVGVLAIGVCRIARQLAKL